MHKTKEVRQQKSTKSIKHQKSSKSNEVKPTKKFKNAKELINLKEVKNTKEVKTHILVFLPKYQPVSPYTASAPLLNQPNSPCTDQSVSPYTDPVTPSPSPFLKYVVSIWALPVRGMCVIKACQDGLGHFFPTLPGVVRACQDGLGHFLPRLPV